MARRTENIDPVYSHLVVRKSFAISIAIASTIIFSLVMFFIYVGLVTETHWSVLALIASSTCSFLIMFPPVEKWEYRPWQKQSQKVEQHFNE